MALEGVLEGFWEAKNLDFRNFFEKRSIKNASRNQVEEHVGKKLAKSCVQRPRVDLTIHRVEDFWAKLPAGGVGGVQPKTNMLVI